MTSARSQIPEEEFAPPGSITVSLPALQFAKDFAKVVRGLKGDHILTFDWAESITLKRSPDAEPEDIGACLTLGAFERWEIPPSCTQTVEGVEFVIRIPRSVWAARAERLIDLDESLPFKLVLR